MTQESSLFLLKNEAEDIVSFEKVIKQSILFDSDKELDNFFGDLKSAVLITDNNFKLIYANNTAFGLTSENNISPIKGSMLIDYIKGILNSESLIKIYEALISKKKSEITTGFSLNRIEKILINPIGAEGYTIKILLNELYVLSASNLFRYFPGLPVAYIGFDLLAGKRMSIRFLSDNFETLFPSISKEEMIKDENRFISQIHPEDLPNFLIKIKNLKKNNNSFSFDFRIANNGHYIWYQMIAGRFTEGHDKNFWLAYLADINDKKTSLIEKEEIVYETIDSERNRMAMELHDDLGQNLVAINLYLSMINSENMQEKLEVCRNLIINGISTMKSLCYNIAPPNLEKGILYALDGYFGRLNELSIDISYSFSAKTQKELVLSQSQSYNIFRMVQEFVSNSQKYSKCSIIECQILQKNQKIILIIFDNGIGFDFLNSKRGFGLDNLEKRAKIADVKYEFSSTIEEGTYMILEF